MTFAPKKTYSKRGNDFFDVNERDKENVDPFDLLLASPLKQDVQFQSLGFWDKKIRELESKRKKGIEYRLYEGSDSGGQNSSWKKSKTRTSQTKSKISKLSGKRNTCSTDNSFIKKVEQQVLSKEKVTLKSAKKILKTKDYSSRNINDSLNSCLKNSDCFKCKNGPVSNENLIKFNRKFKKTNSSNFKSYDEKINMKNLRFMLYDENSPRKLLKGTNESIINKHDDLMSKTVCFNNNMEETQVLLYKRSDQFKYVTTKRDFNIPKCLKFNKYPVSVYSKRTIISPIQSINKEIDSVSLSMSENDTIEAGSSRSSDKLNDSLIYYEHINKILCPEDTVSSQMGNEESVNMLESPGNKFSNDSDFIYCSNSQLQDIEELKEEEGVDVTTETSSTSDDTFTEQDTVIRISPEPVKAVSVADPQVVNEGVHSGTSPNRVSLLMSGISDLSITKVTEDDEKTNPGTEKLGSTQNSKHKDDSDSSFSVELRNVTTKRGGFYNSENEKSGITDNWYCDKLNDMEEDFEPDKTFELSCVMGRISLDWNKTVSLGNPVFESTRVYDTGLKAGEIPQKQSRKCETISSISEESSGLDHTYVLRPGKQWIRSMSVLRQIQNGNFSRGDFESTRITGRKFESSVKDLLKMQNEKPNFSATTTDVRVLNETLVQGNIKNKFPDHLSLHKSAVECGRPRENDSEELGDSVFSRSISHNTVLGRSLFNHTVKVVESDDNSSTFRSALGLDSNRSLTEGSTEDDVIPKKNSELARNFILNLCGQEDVLPFEEYFNEKTLSNCKKIGEGVYGEVFMCSDTVIKIIPIEGSEQVNGAPQKTFEEIISEVVISSKLSNLREGDLNRTDGFSEMKGCWCVKGKYPEYLLKLWNAYDQLGGGSENDSPVMFKEDQLYIILELANGGKDLESFVFASSLQTLSVFIQTAFSLAVAEKAFQFEHRDLHWGNILISKTSEKFMPVALDGVEYKIPTKGVKVCIIDFTLSRINHEGCCIFNDLASDPELFAAHGDYQFEIYRMMQKELKDNWSLFNPKTNLFWLHYTIDKMIKMVRYKIRNSKAHTKYMKDLKTLESIILEHKNSTSFVLSKSLTDVLIKL